MVVQSGRRRGKERLRSVLRMNGGIIADEDSSIWTGHQPRVLAAGPPSSRRKVLSVIFVLHLRLKMLVDKLLHQCKKDHNCSNCSDGQDETAIVFFGGQDLNVACVTNEEACRSNEAAKVS